MYHDMGLIGGFLSTMYWGMTMVLMLPEAFIFRPFWWLENISRYRVTMGVAPNFGYHYCVTRIDNADAVQAGPQLMAACPERRRADRPHRP